MLCTFNTYISVAFKDKAQWGRKGINEPFVDLVLLAGNCPGDQIPQKAAPERVRMKQQCICLWKNTFDPVSIHHFDICLTFHLKSLAEAINCLKHLQCKYKPSESSATRKVLTFSLVMQGKAMKRLVFWVFWGREMAHLPYTVEVSKVTMSEFFISVLQALYLINKSREWNKARKCN